MTGTEREPIHGGLSDSGVTWEVDAEGYAEIRFDTPGSRVNLVRFEALAAPLWARKPWPASRQVSRPVAAVAESIDSDDPAACPCWRRVLREQPGLLA